MRMSCDQKYELLCICPSSVGIVTGTILPSQVRQSFICDSRVAGWDRSYYPCVSGSPLVVKKVIEGFSSVVFSVGFVQGLGADDPGLEIITEVGLVLDFDRLIDTFTALVRGMGIIKTTPPATSDIRETGGTMIDPGRFTLDPGIFAATPAA